MKADEEISLLVKAGVSFYILGIISNGPEIITEGGMSVDRWIDFDAMTKDVALDDTQEFMMISKLFTGEEHLGIVVGLLRERYTQELGGVAAQILDGNLVNLKLPESIDNVLHHMLAYDLALQLVDRHKTQTKDQYFRSTDNFIRFLMVECSVDLLLSALRVWSIDHDMASTLNVADLPAWDQFSNRYHQAIRNAF